MDDDGQETDSEACLRNNIAALMKFYRWDQTELAMRLGKDQSWVSRHLSAKPPPKGARFQFRDLDLIAGVFGLSPAELLAMKHGNFDRRATGERRSGADRRRDKPPPRMGRPLRRSDDDGKLEGA